jgi:hypothetical protein
MKCNVDWKTLEEEIAFNLGGSDIILHPSLNERYRMLGFRGEMNKWNSI